MPWLKFEYNTDQVGGEDIYLNPFWFSKYASSSRIFKNQQQSAVVIKKTSSNVLYGILLTYLKYEHFESGSVFRFQGGLDPDRLKRLQIRNSPPMEYRSSCNPYYLFLKCRSACYIKVVIFCENHHTTKFLHLPAMWTGKPFKAPVIG